MPPVSLGMHSDDETGLVSVQASIRHVLREVVGNWRVTRNASRPTNDAHKRANCMLWRICSNYQPHPPSQPTEPYRNVSPLSVFIMHMTANCSSEKGFTSFVLCSPPPAV